MAEILVVGSVALDTVETTHERRDDVIGGSGTFFSAAGSLFAPVRLVAVVGGDFPEDELQNLARRGVDLTGLERVPTGRTFRWAGRYTHDFAMRETLDTQLNVFETFAPKIPERFRDTPYVFLANIDPELQLGVLEQMRRPKLVACDTMNYWIKNKRAALERTLSKVDIVVVNDEEARELSGRFSLVRAAEEIRRLGPKAVIIKLGPYGALYLTDKSSFLAPSYPLANVRDPTGAGDSFAGAFMGALARVDDLGDASVRKALVLGSVVASFAIEGFGPSTLYELGGRGIEERFSRLKDLTHFDDGIGAFV